MSKRTYYFQAVKCVYDIIVEDMISMGKFSNEGREVHGCRKWLDAHSKLNLTKHR